MRKTALCICKNKGADQQVIRAFVFATPDSLNLKLQAPSHLLWLYSLVCVGPGRKTGFLKAWLKSLRKQGKKVVGPYQKANLRPFLNMFHVTLVKTILASSYKLYLNESELFDRK